MLSTKISRRFTAKTFRLSLLALCSCSFSLLAQQAPPCKGPAEIESAIATKPSAAAYDALGAYFARRNQMTCALPAFQSAVKLAPSASEAHYDLGIALLQSGAPERAAAELRSRHNSIAVSVRAATCLLSAFSRAKL